MYLIYDADNKEYVSQYTPNAYACMWTKERDQALKFETIDHAEAFAGYIADGLEVIQC